MISEISCSGYLGDDVERIWEKDLKGNIIRLSLREKISSSLREDELKRLESHLDPIFRSTSYGQTNQNV